MLRLKTNLILLFCFAASNLFANGLMMPANENYPKDFLRNTVTHVSVNIYGLVAETYVYQEFKNEWHDSTDAVFSFPLPPEARATEFIYWYDNTAYRAVLKVKEQATNPGTGEGGVAALVNDYIGRNGIKVQLKGIAPGKVQKVQLSYISVCDYYAGDVTYSFPLDTEEFATYPLNDLEFNINVQSNSPITGYGSATYSSGRVIQSTENELQVTYSEPKAYMNKDFEFSYVTDQAQMGVDFYTVADDSADGHFAMFIRPDETAPADSILPKRVIFLLSQAISGYRFEQSKTAIKNMLTKLTPGDQFNVMAFRGNTNPLYAFPVAADSANITTAIHFIDGVESVYGNDLQEAIETSFEQIADDDYNNMIFAFTDGRTPLDPRALKQMNQFTTGIFPVGIGDDLLRARLEMTAILNHGFVTYIDDNDNMNQKIDRLYDMTANPIMKDVTLATGRADVTQMMPEEVPALYAGSMFYVTGRYQMPGASTLTVEGRSKTGNASYDFQFEFSARTDRHTFAKYLWAKMMIDALEREIEIYGETAALKQELIDLSLEYNIRCRYTAYIADYETEYVTSIEQTDRVMVPESYIAGNYPNPFNPSTTIRIFIGQNDAGSVKLLRIYNILGQLVAVIDISHFSAGWHEISFNGRDMNGNALPSGIYLLQFTSNGVPVNTIKMNLLK